MLVGYTLALYKTKLEICISAEPSVPFCYPSVDSLGENGLFKNILLEKLCQRVKFCRLMKYISFSLGFANSIALKVKHQNQLYF